MRSIVRLAFVAGLAAAVGIVGVGTAPPAHADPPFFGSLGGLQLNVPVTAIADAVVERLLPVRRGRRRVRVGDAEFRGSLGRAYA